MKKLYALIFVLAGFAAHAQTPANSCGIGQVITSQLVNTGQGCSVTAAPLGSYIVQTGVSGALTSQTVCDTSSNCPAGFYTLHVYINPVVTGTLVSATTGTITYTDEVGTKTNVPMGGSVSLLSTTPGWYTVNFYHAANTAVTVATSVTTLTGSPTYTFRARLIWLGA